jgi:hypothetical protein
MDVKDNEELRKGLILLAVGTWLLFNTLGLFGLAYHRSWPLLLILIGLAMTIAPKRSERCSGVRSGVFLMAWGVLAWVATSSLWGFGWDNIWPLFLIGLGLSIVWKAVNEQRRKGAAARSRSHE